jgi:hypothetical protein
VAIQFNTYDGLRSAVLSWLLRPGDDLLDARFDDFLAAAEQRIFFGYATDDVSNPLRSDPLRIPEMEIVDLEFSMTGSASGDSARVSESGEVRVPEDYIEPEFIAGMTGQPESFLELISVVNNQTNRPLKIVSQRILDRYGTQGIGGTRLVAVSGLNFRFYDPPSGDDATCVLRYFQRLPTPTAAESNDILTLYPSVYLYSCLVEADTFTQDLQGATAHLSLYNAAVSGLNARAQRITASAVPVIRLSAGFQP